MVIQDLMPEHMFRSFFITGSRGAGKSFLVNSIASSFDSVIVRTAFTPDRNTLKLSTFQDRIFKVAFRKKHQMIPVVEAFDRAADQIDLLDPGERLLLVDEVGYLEECSHKYMSAITSLLKRSSRFICVLRQGQGEFVVDLRKRIDGQLILLSRSNQQEAFQHIIETLKKKHLGDTKKGKDNPSPGGDGGI